MRFLARLDVFVFVCGIQVTGSGLAGNHDHHLDEHEHDDDDDDQDRKRNIMAAESLERN